MNISNKNGFPLVRWSLVALFTAAFLTGCGNDSDEVSETPPISDETAPDQASKPVQDPIIPPSKTASAPGANDLDQPHMTGDPAETTTEGLPDEKTEEAGKMAGATEVSDGQSMYATCAGCHGQNGEGGVGPKLQGQSKDDLVSKLKTYHEGKEIGPMSSMMIPQAQPLTEEQIEKVAEYITTL